MRFPRPAEAGRANDSPTCLRMNRLLTLVCGPTSSMHSLPRVKGEAPTAPALLSPTLHQLLRSKILDRPSGIPCPTGGSSALTGHRCGGDRLKQSRQHSPHSENPSPSDVGGGRAAASDNCQTPRAPLTTGGGPARKGDRFEGGHHEGTWFRRPPHSRHLHSAVRREQGLGG